MCDLIIKSHIFSNIANFNPNKNVAYEMIKSQLFSKSILVLFVFFLSMSLVYAQKIPDYFDIPKELILKNKVKSYKVLVTTNGNKDKKQVTNHEISKTLYDKNANIIYLSNNDYWGSDLGEAEYYTFVDTLLYDDSQRLIQRNIGEIIAPGADTTYYPFAKNEIPQYFYKYDNNSNCIAILGKYDKNVIKINQEFIYNSSNKKVKEINYKYETIDMLSSQGRDTTIMMVIKDTISYKYNSKGYCIEQWQKGFRTIYEYNKQGLLIKQKDYQGDLNFPNFINYKFYNKKKQIIKHEFYTSLAKNEDMWKQFTNFYSYYLNGLIKSNICKWTESDIKTYTIVYGYWD